MGGLIAAGVIFTVLVLALDEDGRQGFPAGVRLPVETAEGASWSPNGRWVAVPNRAGVLLRGAGGNSERQLRAPRTPRYFGHMPGRIGWSRDGKELRYVTTVGPGGGEGPWVTVVPTDGGEPRQASLGIPTGSVDWSPRGWRLVFTPGPGATSDRADGLWALERLGGNPHRLLNVPGREREPEVSPDGTRILFTVRRGAADEIWVARADGSGARRLGGPFTRSSYAWARDGRRVALVAARDGGDGQRHLYLLSPRNGDLRRLGDADLSQAAPSWSPGGRWIAYATLGGAIEKVRPRGGPPERLAEFPGEQIYDLLYSPNGRRIAYSSEEVVSDD